MNNSVFQNLKLQQRLLLKKQINSLSRDDRDSLSVNLNNNLKRALNKLSGRWGAFSSLPSEPKINWSDLNSNIQWYFVETQGQNLIFIKDTEVLNSQDLDGVCIPALGFNLNGARLGRGGGYYDRELQNFKGTKMGISYDFAVHRDVPFETHDIKVDVIVTDRRIVDAA